MFRSTVRLVLLALVASWAAAPALAADPAPTWALIGQPGIVTLVNLHPDPTRNKLSSVNYLQDGLIPVCTPVELISLGKKKLEFRTVDPAVEYKYEFHKSMQGAKEAHLERIFGPAKSCPKARIAKLSKVDQAGIKGGIVTPGMSKAAVVIAIGYPPEHATASLDLDQWMYWRNRFDRKLVMFAKDRVTEVRN